jgi:hypothetical protein
VTASKLEEQIMSYTVEAPGQRRRPATVTAASALLYLVGFIELASVIVSILSIGEVLTIIDEEFAGEPEADLISTVTTWSLGVSIASAVLFAAGAVVLGLLVGKGKNPARIVTWVLAGIGVLCYGCGLAGSAVSSSLQNMSGAASDPQAEEVQRRVTEAIPAWQPAVSTIASVIVLLAFLAVIILLALPVSNDFFRREQEVWVPPTWPGDAAAGFPPPPAPPASWPTEPPAPPAGPQYPPPPPQG